MKKAVAIVGVGLSADTLTQEGLRAIGQAEVLVGAPRLLKACAPEGARTCAAFEPERVEQIVRDSEMNRFAVLVSGDTGFYSAADSLCAALKEYELTLIPGVSSMSCFFARLKRPWQDAALVSCHGREANLADTVRRNRLTFALTGGNAPALARSLTEAGFGDLLVHVGENLGMEGERVTAMRACDLSRADVAALSVLLVENPDWDSRERTGIPDKQFVRGDVPMTKAEVRAVILSKLMLSPESVCCDIGAGTGSVTVEMALAAHKGRVYAIDKNEEAIGLVKENCKAFHIGNVTPVLGGAPEALAGLPPVDAAFIGGSGGNLCDIAALLLARNPAVRLVVSTVTLETLAEATAAFGRLPVRDVEIVQIAVSRAKHLVGHHLMMAQNPVFIISGTGSPA